MERADSGDLKTAGDGQTFRGEAREAVCPQVSGPVCSFRLSRFVGKFCRKVTKPSLSVLNGHTQPSRPAVSQMGVGEFTDQLHKLWPQKTL